VLTWSWPLSLCNWSDRIKMFIYWLVICIKRPRIYNTVISWKTNRTIKNKCAQRKSVKSFLVVGQVLPLPPPLLTAHPQHPLKHATGMFDPNPTKRLTVRTRPSSVAASYCFCSVTLARYAWCPNALNTFRPSFQTNHGLRVFYRFTASTDVFRR